MAEVIWTEPALADLDAIADYIALDDARAAGNLVRKIFEHVGQLAEQPESGSKPPELRKSLPRYRQIVEPPCRVFYRYEPETDRVFVIYVMRGEMRLRKNRLTRRDQTKRRGNA